MAGWTYKSSLANGTRLNAVELMGLMSQAKRAIDAVEDDYVEFLSETLSFSMSTTGHTHNGSDGTEVASPTDTVRGGLKYYSHTSLIDHDSYKDPSGVTIDFNSGSTINTIMAAVVMWRGGGTEETWSPPDGRAGMTTYNMASDRGGSDPYGTYYWVIDKTGSKDKLWVWNALTLDALGSMEFTAWIVGV